VTIIAFQPELCPALPLVVGNVDYRDFKTTLERIDVMLVDSGVESAFVRLRLQQVVAELDDSAEDGRRRRLGPKARNQIAEHAVRALRCNVARALVGGSCREFSWRLADSPLLQWFCRLGRLDVVRVPSKSTLDRYGRLVPEALVRKVVDHLNVAAAATSGSAGGALDLEEPLSLDALLLDTTCVAANIHFPVDWVLLRDAARTLIKGIIVIRRHGLRHRIGDPGEFLRQVNRLCIEMTHSRRRPDGSKQRKRILRALKKLLKTIDGHARRYRDLLADHWDETDLHAGEVQQILARLDGVREQLPAAIQQAHERIIGGRQVANADKLLSLYEPDIHVLVRGKAGAEVEFGNTLLLAEQPEGVIVDWRLVQAQAPADSKFVSKSLARFANVFGGRRPAAIVGDRGFDSARNRDLLRQRGVVNAICPRRVSELRERLQDERFMALQARRGQTEARIGILKNGFLGRPCLRKGFVHRELYITWSVLSHNLWVIARLPVAAKIREHPAA
jgi:hypothetical protein